MTRAARTEARSFVTRPASNETQGVPGIKNGVMKGMAANRIMQRHYPANKLASMTARQKERHTEALKSCMEKNFATAWNRAFPVGSKTPTAAQAKAFLAKFAAGYRPPWNT